MTQKTQIFANQLFVIAGLTRNLGLINRLRLGGRNDVPRWV